jgi:tetratricopeptide (TPR) repeat protein
LRTTKISAPPENHPATKPLSWWIGGVALLLYWVTLSHWISLANLGTVARISNWPEATGVGRPLTLAVFAPLRLLPEPWLPPVMNVITAICAALVLVQLARSVSILRLDIVSADPMRQKVSGQSLFTGPWSWLPPVFAALALGLQLGFWEHATSASGEILSVLCFAYAFRCVLEFRLEAHEAWLYRGAFVYALGVTDNWLMLGYLPVFVAAIIWVKGFSPCLEWRFFWRITAWALLGLTLYLLVPLTQHFSAAGPTDFWTALKSHIGAQKHSLTLLRGTSLRLLALTGVLPFLLLAVRWRSHSVQLADDTHIGVFFTKASGHFIHTLFLVTALWVALNPAFTPPQWELNAAFLVYYYAWALVAGYGIAYVLLFGLPRARKAPARWPAALATLLLVAVPVTLGWKNFSSMRLTSGGALKEFAAQLYDDLPTGNVTVLSDEPLPLLLLRAELSLRAGEKSPLLIDTRALPNSKYRERLARDYGSRWPALALTNQTERLNASQLVALVSQLATSEPVVYLHPSSGLFFESFVGVPRGWVLRLMPRAQKNMVGAKRAATEAQQRWQQHWDTTLAVRARQFTAHRQHTTQFASPTWKNFKLSGRLNETAQVLGDLYAKALNYWGVQAQQAGRASEAREWFQRAIIFNPDNLVAQLNLEFAERRQRGNTNRLTLAWLKETCPATLAKYQTWPEVIGRNGPVDEPTFLLHSGRMYLAAANPNQALDCFSRSAELAADWVGPKLCQAQALNTLGEFAAAEKLSAAILPQETSLRAPGLVQLLQVRTTALWRLGRANEAAAFVVEFAARHQDTNEVVLTAAELCAATGDFESELRWRELLVGRDPKRVEWLVKKGHAELRARKSEAAIETLTAALMLMPDNPNARLFRAVAALQAGKLADAQRDYAELLKSPTHSQRALFGLGGIAWRQQDTNAMIQYYQSFLSNNVATPQAAVATQRLKEWQEE